MKYRAEIDGLRALAVVPVILFHAGFELFSGGFVGVDVFFVISGYLITTILVEDIENKRFSIVNFYERRARRILPTLFFVMLVCIPFAWMWMLPNQMKDFSQSLVAVSLFASNILFWRENDYFDAAAEEKPLLHTWSLAVEEQYYVLFPIFLILAWRFGKNRVFWMIVVMAAISLLLSEWGWRNKATANFYLAPARAWELFSGSIAAFIVQQKGVQKNNPLAMLGLAAIIFSIFFYDETTPFPSVYALVPVLGVVLLVLYADKETLAAKLLSTKGFVGIGLISYSAYLWHQPLFAFSRIYSLEHPSQLLMLALSFLSILLAYFSWRFIETPFRDRKKISKSSLFVIAVIALGFLTAFGLIGHKTNGFEMRLPDGFVEQDALSVRLTDNDGVACFGNREPCVFGMGERFIHLLGDSHLGALSPSFVDKLADNYKLSILQSGECLPVLHVQKFRYRTDTNNLVDENCDLDFQRLRYEFIRENLGLVIVLARYPVYLSNGVFFDNLEGGVERDSYRPMVSTRGKSIAEEFEQFVVTLSEIPGVNVAILNSVPEVGFNVPSAAMARYLQGHNDLFSTSFDVFSERNMSTEILLSKVEVRDNISIIDIHPLFCDSEISNRCIVEFPLGNLFYQDDDHLNSIGASIVTDHVIDSLSLSINE